jgi:hypothetical protein
VTVPGGEISVLDPGDFGPVVITKSVTILGGSTPAGILADFSNGVVVNVITPGDPGVVVLRGLFINGVGTGLDGIRYLVGAKLVIEQCNVYGFTQNDLEVSQVGPKNLVVKNTTLTSGAAGIHLADTTGADTLVQVTNSLIVGNTGYGVHAEGKGTISVANSLLANNGVAVRANNGVAVRGNNGVAEGANNGVAEGANNGVAVRADTPARVRLSNNEIFDNTTGLQGCRWIASAGNNKRAGSPGCSPGAAPITVE